MVSHTSEAEARSSKCRIIERQLASLDAYGTADLAGYGSAIRQQRREIALTEQSMRSYQCTRSRHPSCRRLNNTLNKMFRNLEKLEQRYYSRSASPRQTAAKRKRLERDLRRYRCDEPRQRVAKLERPNLFERLFSASNRRIAREDVRKNSGDILDDVFGSHSDADRRRQARLDRRAKLQRELDRQLWSTPSQTSNSGKYRTICVRRCDGYYFPVSHATDESGFAQDAAACNLMCPGTQMELFSHRTDGETPEQMISTIDGTLYTSLKTAFSHREKFDPKCACNFKLVKRSYNIDIPDSIRLAKLTNKFFKEKKTALPSWRTDQEVAQSKPTITSQRPKESPDLRDPRQEVRVYDRRKRNIRVIGDAFFPTQ
ncbi:MAG: DUF2865 domain-containing protein [Rhizobiaceae bacterium]|nr:DUF2865 domain-containing protein [Hyphomicrobiales bacterium]NRB29884.1 DUF2865 domain-containing protein [Rhizobiaceae bacterium]